MKDQLESLIAQMHSSGILYTEAVREFKKRFILHVLEQNRFNQFKAAAQLGMHRNTLSRVIRDLKIDFRHCKRGYQRKPVWAASQTQKPRAMGASA